MLFSAVRCGQRRSMSTSEEEKGGFNFLAWIGGAAGVIYLGSLGWVSNICVVCQFCGTDLVHCTNKTCNPYKWIFMCLFMLLLF